jgi:hypothetical protein
MKMGRRLSGDCQIGHVSIQICSLSASLARTALPAAHFDRNKLPLISGNRTLVKFR